ncbi:MAG: PepSY domain-containing protein [Caulobacterales bacterium]|nr:PepSY domain-containing protein [Caulobacterales bacterium]MCA0372548.1 PepSY domain-containing protein [Pseudomonadota bacterium]
MKKLFAFIFVSLLAFANNAQAKPSFKFGGNNSATHMGFAQDKIMVADNGRVLSLRDVAQIINSQVPGSVLDAQGPVDVNGRKVYYVRWQSNRGAIILFEVDAETGQILRRAGG